jgi:sugar phosphate permease
MGFLFAAYTFLTAVLAAYVEDKYNSGYAMIVCTVSAVFAVIVLRF